MIIDYYKSFVLTADYCSMTKAAKQLGTNIYKVRNDISKLEKETKFILFSRGNRTYLTEQGKIFYRYALSVIEAYNRMEIELNKLKNRADRTIYLSATPVFYLTGLYNQYDFSSICDKVIPVVSSIKEMYNNLLMNNVDFCFMNQSDRKLENKGIKKIPLITYNLCFLVSKYNSLYANDEISIDMITDQVILTDKDIVSPAMQKLINTLGKNNEIKNISSDNYYQINSHIKDSSEMVLWCYGCNKKKISKQLKSIILTDYTDTSYLVYKDEEGKDETAEKLADIIKKYHFFK